MSGSSSCAGVWNLKDDEGAGGSSRSRPSSRPQSATRPAAGASFTCGSTAPRSPPPRAASPTRPRSALASGVVSSKPSSAQKQAERINRFETDVNPVLGKAVAEAIRADDGNPLYYIGAYLMRASGHAAPPPLPMTMNSLRAGAAAATEAWPPESQPAYTGAESPNGATGTPKSVSTLSAAPEDDENRKMHQRVSPRVKRRPCLAPASPLVCPPPHERARRARVSQVAQRAVEKGREKKKSATVGEPTWTAKDWLKAEGIADEVCKLFLQPLLKATEKIMGKEKFDDASIELELVRSLHAEADADAGATERAIAALLNESNCLSTLAKFVAKKIDKLGSGATSSGEALNTKFVEDYKGRPMTFGTQKDFFSGLGGLIGPPNPNLLEGMRWEHCERKDSYEKFETSNTQTTTTSHAEFYFVTDPEMLTSQLGTGDDAVKKQKTAENQKRLKGQQVLLAVPLPHACVPPPPPPPHASRIDPPSDHPCRVSPGTRSGPLLLPPPPSSLLTPCARLPPLRRSRSCHRTWRRGNATVGCASPRCPSSSRRSSPPRTSSSRRWTSSRSTTRSSTPRAFTQGRCS